ncbi:LPS assembly protein LptD [Pelagibacteraceae bacterium]|nr:LPS assembly protein LptD [Pelagibacteraceae bacterium]
MKNSLIILLFVFIFQPLLGENLNIKSSNISINKKEKISVFKDSVVATDAQNNIFKSEYAEYKKDLKLLISKGKTTILTSSGYFLTGNNITFDNQSQFIRSDEPAKIKDLENNNIYLENFEYSTKNSFFKSVGKIKVVDSKNNKYNFSQIYIDEKKKEIIGTDIKAFINQESFKVKEANNPRVFANAVKINNQKNEFTKSIFTLCEFREDDKCPPWSLQAGKMTHDKNKKTIYYDNAVIKIYDFPVLYLPKLAHPDPTVSRRTGFLPPTFSSGKNLGTALGIPYFWAIDEDKDFTLSSKLFTSEHPLFLGEYRQSFQKSDLILDFGHTEGYKKTTSKKKAGNKSHFFSEFVKKFKGKEGSDNEFSMTVQRTSNKKYLKLYKIDTNLANYENDVLENSINFSHSKDDLFFGFKASAYEDLKISERNNEYEYILPDLILDKNLFSGNKFGYADLQTNLKFRNFETNKQENFLINDIDWKYEQNNFASGLTGRLLGKLRNVNYETKNTDEYKKDTTNELFGAIGYLTEISFFKENNKSNHTITPKMLLRYAPNHMRKDTSGSRINPNSVFKLDRLDSNTNLESGLSSTIGFDYQLDQKLDFSIAQVINEKENNKMPSSSSLNQRFSDVVGQSKFDFNDNVSLKYNFALDQNYKKLNYNEVGTTLNLNAINFDFNYLQEREHIGNQEYFRGSVNFASGKNSLFSAETKRNLITNSAEYYNMSYEYHNDCLRAGLVYRREFYNDSEIEPENSLMFKITLTPFGDISSPSFN